MHRIYIYDNAFAHTITSTYGTKGATWLAQFPQFIEQCAARWSLTELQPYPHLTYNYVLSGVMKDAPIVLKLRCSAVELALKVFESHGGVKVLAQDNNLGAMLLERAMPGDALTSFFPHNDAQASCIAADLIHKLHQASIVGEFPLLQNVLPDLSKEPQALLPFLARARELKAELLATQKNQVLLHGDFHHGNILSAGSDQWVVIDPEGIIGDPVYDLAVYIRNPIKELVATHNAHEIIANRIHDFAQLLGYDAQRIYDWAYVQAVCSAYWSTEDGLEVSNHVKFLNMLAYRRH